MRPLDHYINKFAKSRRGTFASQTTICEINGEAQYRQVPEAEIPIFPVLTLATLFTFLDKNPKNVLDHGYEKIPVTAARYAIAQALNHMDISPGDEILIPAYHCTVMVAPIIEMDCIPVFYKITPELETDITDVRSKITAKTKAIIAVNYCGFIQNMAAVHRLCEEEKIILIEDCAHSYFGQKNGVTVGGYGDYILVSARKFFPVTEGGILLIRSPHKKLPVQQRQSVLKSLKSFLSLIERPLKYGKLWLLVPLVILLNSLITLAKKILKKIPAPQIEAQDQKTHQQGENSYNHSLMNTKAAFIDEISPLLLNSTKITNRRRASYLWLSERISKMNHCRVMFTDLPEGTVPFMLPVYIEDLDKYFPAFEDAALPMQRFAQFLWPDMNKDTCPHTADFSKNVILFPCHQALNKKDLLWLESTLRKILEQK